MSCVKQEKNRNNFLMAFGRLTLVIKLDFPGCCAVSLQILRRSGLRFLRRLKSHLESQKLKRSLTQVVKVLLVN